MVELCLARLYFDVAGNADSECCGFCNAAISEAWANRGICTRGHAQSRRENGDCVDLSHGSKYIPASASHEMDAQDEMAGLSAACCPTLWQVCLAASVKDLWDYGYVTNTRQAIRSLRSSVSFLRQRLLHSVAYQCLRY